MKGTELLLLFAVTFCRGAVISHDECSADSRLLAHENCNQYYQCVNGAFIVRNCSSILYFNPEIQECDWPVNVDCSDNNDQSDEEERCSSGKAEGQFFVHENCNQYYRCVHGNLIEQTCHSGLLYNYEISQCDWPYNFDCKGVTQNPDETETPVTESEKPDVDVTPHPDNSNETTSDENESDEENKSEEGEEDSSVDSSDESDSSDDSDEDSDNNSDSNEDRSKESTSNEGETSAEDSNKDESDEDVGTESDVNKVCAADNSEGVLMPHENCSKYYICAGGKPAAMDCPAGLVFNAVTEQCDWPKNVDCDNNWQLLKKLEINVGVTLRGKKGFKA